MKEGILLIIIGISLIMNVLLQEKNIFLNNQVENIMILYKDTVNANKKESKPEKKEEVIIERHFITELKSLGDSSNTYKMYYEENRNNNFLGEDIFGQNLYVVYYLEIETSEDYDEIIYNKTGRDGIQSKKIDENKYQIEIKSFFDLSSDITKGNIAFVKDFKVVGTDEIIVENEEIKYKYVVYNRYSTETFNLRNDLSISVEIQYIGDTSNQQIEIKNYDDYMISKFNSLRGWGDWGYQYVYNLSGNKIDKINNSEYKEYFHIGNQKYNYVGLNFEYEAFTYYPKNKDYLLFDLESFDDMSNLDKTLFQEEGILPQNIYVGIKGNPYIFKYTLEDIGTPNISFGVVNIEKADEKYIAKDGKVSDLAFTKKILKQISEVRKEDSPREKDNFKVIDVYYEDVYLDFFQFTEIEDFPDYFEEKDIPLINLYKLDNKGNYSLSFYPPYDLRLSRN